ncbi:hypothetical protein V8F20_001639 [Naviculisporaceae sp. PSN 640]
MFRSFSTSSANDEILANFNVTRPDPRDYGPGRAISISDDDVPMPKTVGALAQPSNKALPVRKVGGPGPNGTASYDGLSTSDSLTPASAPWLSSPDMEGFFNAGQSPSRSARVTAIREVLRSPSRQATGRGDIENGNFQDSQANQQVLPIHTTPRKSDWTVDKIATALTAYYGAVEQNHSQLVEFLFEVAENETWPDLRTTDTPDPFAGMSSCAFDPTAPPPQDIPTTSIKIKQHSGEYGKSKGGQGRRTWYPVTCIKSDREPVPKYTFHHVEVRKNILTPNTMLNFVPHLRDVDPNSADEKKYNKWLMELESLDSQSGFKTKDRSMRVARRSRDEFARVLAVYLERWLKELNIDGCSVPTLIRFMASHSRSDDAITPQQKSDIFDTYATENPLTPQEIRGAEIFTEAFDRVFDVDLAKRSRTVSLRDVLMLNKSIEAIVDIKRAKDTPSSQKHQHKTLLERVEEKVGSYSALQCLICFSNDCEHGELTPENQRGAFCLDMAGGFQLKLKEKWVAQVEAARDPVVKAQKKMVHAPCKNQCYRNYDVGNDSHPIEPWTESEISTLEQIFAALGHSPTLKPQCFVAAMLGRKCWEVYRKLKELDLKLPDIDVPYEKPKAKPVSWYDRKKKQLIGDWESNVVSHDFSNRNIVEPCSHEGPCVKGGEDDRYCPCAEANLLCERFCHCTAECCAIKFAGCACRSSGKTCIQKQKEGKPCICVQLNRECDPVLCGCGASERADPENAYDDQLHRTGCQNVPLQRGASKTVLLGKSQLPACGYGLFTAEDIAQDEFVIEYTGELISHDEGVRREARRGDVFDEAANSSYLFTLLENEGIWVDAAIYGNLSRYINHASESDRKACNITPKVVYVNGEFRIKFTALRDIKAGEELFFNYGDYFPNLTKKLLEDGGNDGAGAKEADMPQRIKATKSAGKKKGGRRQDDWMTGLDNGDDDDDMAGDYMDHSPKKIKKKRGGRRPGAGRKKKVQPGDAAAAAAAAAPTSTAASQPTTRQPSVEISDSQAEGSQIHTPSRRRIARRGSASQSASPDSGNEASLVRAQLMQNSPNGMLPARVKKHNRGGARPGAGRKPKNKHPSKTDSSKSSPASGANGSGGENNKTATATDDSEDLPLQSAAAGRIKNNAQAAASGGGTTNTGNGTGRKRTRDAVLAADSESDLDRNRSNHSGPWLEAGRAGASGDGLPFRQDTFQVISDTPMEEDEDDDDSVVDRSARKRQKPSRYRDDE